MIFYSAIQPAYLLLPCLGFVVGMLGSMLGGGGGFIFLPLLILILNVPSQTAVTTSLVATLPICFAGAVGHYHEKNISFRLASIFAISGIVGSFIGFKILQAMSSNALRILFGIYSILMAILITVQVAKDKRLGKQNVYRMKSINLGTRMKGLFFGVISGIITSAFGTSGTAPVLSGLVSMRLPIKMVIGTSLFIVMVNTIFSVGLHFMASRIDLTLVGFLTTGSCIGALGGSRYLSRISMNKKENKLKYLYALTIFVIGMLMIISSLNHNI